jgi:pimeloyl-ACP methyl ester carboxylesterase
MFRQTLDGCWWRKLAVRTMATLLLAGLSAAMAVADEPADGDEEPIPDPERVTLTTDDYVKIRCTYYPSLDGKEAVPVVMIHGWGGQRGEFDALASNLQSAGNAVVTVDLRGHGESTVRQPPDVLQERDWPPAWKKGLDHTKMTRNDIADMARYDLQEVMNFVYEKNNAAELNIDALCVIAAEEGAVVALNWAALDWATMPPTFVGYKNSQWIKAMVLLSPVQAYKGATTAMAMRSPALQREISLLIAAGEKDRSAKADAAKLYSPLKRFRAANTEKNLFYIPVSASFQGTKLLGKPTLKLDGYIAKFIQLRLGDKMADKYPWVKREKP